MVKECGGPLAGSGERIGLEMVGEDFPTWYLKQKARGLFDHRQRQRGQPAKTSNVVDPFQ